MRLLWKDLVLRITCVPIVAVRHQLHNCKRDTCIVNLLLRSLYVDDLITPVFQESYAAQKGDETMGIMAAGRVNLVG